MTDHDEHRLYLADRMKAVRMADEGRRLIAEADDLFTRATEGLEAMYAEGFPRDTIVWAHGGLGIDA